MNNAIVEKSNRLQRVLFVLMRKGKHSTLDIAMETFNCAVGTSISELRAQGYIITCERVGRIYYYELIGKEI